MSRFWGVAKRGTRQAVLRAVLLGVAIAIGAVGVLYVLTHVLAPNSDVDWFMAGCAVLAALGIVGTVATLIWDVIVLAQRRPTRFLLVAGLGAFALVPIAITAGLMSMPVDRPAGAQIWAGYRTTRNGITQVTATWVQPRVRPLGPRRNDVAFWVGLDYPEALDLEQIGTEVTCARHTRTTNHAWYELYPASAVRIAMAIRPGDVVTAAVVRLDEKHFRLTLVNGTTGARFSTVKVASDVGNTHGAVMTEESDYRDTDLAGFGSVRFTRCAFNGRPLEGYRLDGFDVWSDAGVMETATSPVAADGSSFTVTRR
jgi:hypothetical protein